jgi:hypothetical protein
MSVDNRALGNRSTLRGPKSQDRTQNGCEKYHIFMGKLFLAISLQISLATSRNAIWRTDTGKTNKGTAVVTTKNNDRQQPTLITGASAPMRPNPFNSAGSRCTRSTPVNTVSMVANSFESVPAQELFHSAAIPEVLVHASKAKPNVTTQRQ